MNYEQVEQIFKTAKKKMEEGIYYNYNELYNYIEQQENEGIKKTLKDIFNISLDKQNIVFNENKYNFTLDILFYKAFMYI